MGVNEKPLVTILTPCYNSGKFIHRLLDSVLHQDYPNIQMIVVDDGSTDNSAEIIKFYILKFEQKGYRLEYYYQHNGGQSVAINWGLKKVRGEYLLWPDSDDYYRDSDTISKLVDILSELPEDYAMARTWINYLDENNLENIGIAGPDYGEPNFEDCLFCRNFYFAAGCVIVDFKKLKEVTSLEIYTDRHAGQNWQLYLPILYKYKCKTIPEAKYNVLCRAESHSRGLYKTLEQINTKLYSYEKTLLSTLDGIQDLDTDRREVYKKLIREKYAYERFGNALIANNKSKAQKHYAVLKELGVCIANKDLLKYYLIKLNLLGIIRRVHTFLKMH